MTKTVTDYMLREALNKVVTRANLSSTGATPATENNIRTMQEKLITKVCNNTMICDDGTEAELVSPIPCLYWKCTVKPDDKGIATLSTPIGALIVTSDEINYCIGIIGKSNEFEVRLQVGNNEVRINNSFVNITANHFVVNGLEVDTDKLKKEDTSNNGGGT